MLIEQLELENIGAYTERNTFDLSISSPKKESNFNRWRKWCWENNIFKFHQTRIIWLFWLWI